MSLPRLLFDRNIPNPLARHLTGFEIRTTEHEGWNALKNGGILDAAEQAGFFATLSADQNLRYQQNLAGRRLAIVVVSTPKWTELRHQVQSIRAPLDAATPGATRSTHSPPEPPPPRVAGWPVEAHSERSN